MRIILDQRGNVRLAPEALIQAVNVNVTLSPPFDGLISYFGMSGASNAEPDRFNLDRAAAEIERAYNDFIANPEDEDAIERIRHIALPDTSDFDA